MNQTYSTTLYSNRQHLSLTERKEIEKSLKRGFSIRAIAKALHRTPSTISREIKRGSVEQRVVVNSFKKHDPFYVTKLCYFYDVGERIAKENRAKSGGRYKISKDLSLAEYISEAILKYKLSPDAIAGRLRCIENSFNISVCTKTIYNYIDKGLIGVKNIDLLLKVKRKPKTDSERRKNRRNYGKSIDERSLEILHRNTFGHYEGDTIIGKEGNSAIVTLVERLTGKGFLLRTDSKTSEAVFNAIVQSKIKIKTLTLDNGSEFSKCSELEGIDTYYAHPYSAWERGSNENFNGIVRRFLPKGIDLSKYCQEELNAIADRINNMPRKRLGYYTANEMYALAEQGKIEQILATKHCSP